MKHHLLSVLLTLGFLISFAPRVQAQQTTPLYDGLDIVFLIDQSSSMGRIHGGVAPNDPLRLRFYSLIYVASLMGNHHLLVNPQADFRIAVVNFGSTAAIWTFSDGASWQRIAPSTRDEWNKQLQRLKDDFNRMEQTFSDQDLGETNFQAAFEAAHTLFTHAPDTTGKRLRAVVVLTDGQPYIDTLGFNISAHMTDLRAYAQRYFPEPDYRIFALSMADATTAYWQNVEPYWESITHDPCTERNCPDSALDHAVLIADKRDVGRHFREIILNLSQEFPNPAGTQVIDTSIETGPLPVPPYLKSITFTYFKTDLSQRMVITDTHGLLNENRPGVTIEGEEEGIQTIRVKNPSPGIWQITTIPPSADVKITMQAIYAQGILKQPTGTQTQFQPLQIIYALVDETGIPLPRYTDPPFPLEVRTTIDVGGNSISLTLKEDANGTYSAEFTPVVAQRHTVSVYARSHDPEGKVIEIFQGEIGYFDVSPVQVVPAVLPLSWPQYQEQTIILDLQDAGGKHVSLPTPPTVKVSIAGEDAPVSPPSLLADGTYQITYAPQQPGRHTVHVKATVAGIDGTVYTITDDDIAAFDVSPTTRVHPSVVAPTDGQQIATTFIPWQPPLPLVVQVALTDDQGNILEPRQVFADPEKAFTVSSVQDAEGETIDASLEFRLDAAQKTYVARSPNFGLGEYTLDIQGGELQNGYVYGARQIQVSIKRVRHPWYIPILVISIALLIAIVSAIVWVIIHNYRLRQHPCSGIIYIGDAEGIPKFQKRLDGYGKNDITISGKEIPAIVGIQKMRFWCEDDKQSKNKQVFVQVWMEGDNTPLTRLDGRMLSPGSEVRLGTRPYWLYKDPEDGMLAEHPEEQEF